jgi:hypothetical protein
MALISFLEIEAMERREEAMPHQQTTNIKVLRGRAAKK